MIEDVYAALTAALREVPRLRVFRTPGPTVVPPAAVLGPPTFTWDGYRVEPTAATVTAALAVADNDRSLSALLDLLPAVTVALEDVDDVVVRRAAPGSFLSGGTELPAYLIEIEVSL